MLICHNWDRNRKKNKKNKTRKSREIPTLLHTQIKIFPDTTIHKCPNCFRIKKFPLWRANSIQTFPDRLLDTVGYVWRKNLSATKKLGTQIYLEMCGRGRWLRHLFPELFPRCYTRPGDEVVAGLLSSVEVGAHFADCIKN